MEVVARLEEELGRVEAELADCRGEGWGELCQGLLRDSYGMNLLDLQDLLAMVLARRLRGLQEQGFRVLFDGVCLGRQHMLYDIGRVGVAMTRLVEVFRRLGMEGRRVQGEEAVARCREVLEGAGEIHAGVYSSLYCLLHGSRE